MGSTANFLGAAFGTGPKIDRSYSGKNIVHVKTLLATLKQMAFSAYSLMILLHAMLLKGEIFSS